MYLLSGRFASWSGNRLSVRGVEKYNDNDNDNDNDTENDNDNDNDTDIDNDNDIDNDIVIAPVGITRNERHQRCDYSPLSQIWKLRSCPIDLSLRKKKQACWSVAGSVGARSCFYPGVSYYLNITRVFAICQILLGWKTDKYYHETDNLPDPRPTQPKQIRLKVAFRPLFFFPQQVFRGLGLILCRTQTTRNPTRPANTLLYM